MTITHPTTSTLPHYRRQHPLITNITHHHNYPSSPIALALPALPSTPPLPPPMYQHRDHHKYDNGHCYDCSSYLHYHTTKTITTITTAVPTTIITVNITKPIVLGYLAFHFLGKCSFSCFPKILGLRFSDWVTASCLLQTLLADSHCI